MSESLPDDVLAYIKGIKVAAQLMSQVIHYLYHFLLLQANVSQLLVYVILIQIIYILYF